MIRESNFMVVPIAKKVITIIAGRALVSIFFIDGKKLPSKIPKIIGRTAPSKDQLIGDWPVAPRASIVTGGPTTSVVIATAPCSYSLP